MTPGGLGNMLDERFFDRRRRSSSVASMAGALVAGLLFFHHLVFQHVIDWDLFAVTMVMAAVKMGLMGWYYFTD